nr:hypothetical transcript [Hymenolepis microstoma]
MLQANVNQLTLPLVLLLLLLFSPASWAFDGRLSLGAALDTSDKTMRIEFPASVGEQLHLTQYPLEIYGKDIEQIKVYANGFVVLGNHSLELPLNYPSQTAYSKHRLSEMQGDFIGVFTTVNQCSPKGKIIIREVDVNEVESSTCLFEHIVRIGSIIDTAELDGEGIPFLADYVLTITWENMGCVPSSDPLTNTFTLALVRMEDRVYAIFQYDDIQWTADHSTSSLPPEAGIFIHDVDTPQLPRNNMHIEPSVWNEESNIAIPGEWLFPLNEGPIDVDVEAQSKIRMLTEDFLETSETNCADMVVSSPTSTVAGHDGTSFTSPTQESTTMTVPPTSYQTDSESSSSTDYANEVTYKPPSTTYEGVASEGVITNQETTSSYQTTSVKTTYDDFYSTSPSMNLQNCDSGTCKDPISTCFIFNGQNCCVCPSGYYGGGQEGCHPIKPKEARRIYVEGEVNIDLSDRKPITSSFVLDTEIRSANNLLTQSGTHNLPRNFSTIHALSPIFKVLNTFFALPREETSGDHIFNVFSLTSGFTAPFNFSFYVSVGRYGRLRVKGDLKRITSDRDTYKGSLNIRITPDGSFLPLNSPLVDSDGLIQLDNQRDHLIELERVEAGRVEFTPVTFNFISASGEKIAVEIKGDGAADVREGACLLADGSLLKIGQKYAFKLDSQGYCREDCQSEGSCSFYCIDMPIFAKSTSGLQVNSNPKTSVCQLELDAGPCRGKIVRYGFHRQKGHCIEFIYGGCQGNANNFESISVCEAECGNRDNEQPPQQNGGVCSLPIDIGPCRASIRRYAYNPSTRRCEIFTYGGCQGNGNNFETEEECERRCGGSGTVSPPHTGGTGDIGGGVGSGGGDVCSLPSDMGPCSDYVLRYTFNSSTGRCEMFYYGGCEGNENRESNIAIPGEWLFPLNEGPIDVDVEAQSKIRMLTEDFLETSETNCADMVVSSPTSTVAGHDGTSFTSPTQESTTMTVPPTSYQTDSESSSSTDYANEVTYKPPSTTYEGVASEGVITNQETTSSYQTTSVKTTYDDFYSTSPSMNLQNCDSGTCKDPISTCFIFNGQNCCVCPSGYYGGGQEGCHPIKPKEARRIYVEGEVNIDLSDRKPITSSFVLDTEIRSANNLLTQSGTHNLPRNFSTIHALSPIFKVLNTFFALPREETSGDHIFNVFSLTSGFTAPFNFSFYVSVGRYGRLRVKGDLKRITSDRDTYKGSLNIRITPDGSFLPLNSPLVDSDGLIQLDNQRDHLIELERVEAGRVEFTPVTFNFISASGEKIAVEIKGDGAADVREGACLLADGSLLKIGQKYAFKLDSQGYCREDCQSEGSCSFYCIDMPIFAKSTSGLQVNSNPKTSVCQLELDAGPCRGKIVRYGFHRQKGHCIEFIYGGCQGNANNFESISVCEAECGNRDNVIRYISRIESTQRIFNQFDTCGFKHLECRPVSTPERPPPEGTEDTCSKPVDPGPCHASIRRYAYNPSTRRCEIFTYGGCQGNGNNFETEEECERRCGGSGTVSPPHTGGTGDIGGGVGSGGGDVCSLPSDMGPCSDYVLRYTFNSSTGRCEMFYYGGCEGNENRFESLEDCQRRCESSVSRDPCAGVRCGNNAYCVSGYCYCEQGYEGDANVECRPVSTPEQPPQQNGGVCSLPIDIGPCRASIRRYAYNPSTRRCEIFTYGGCQGNGNNFETEEECERRCGGSGTVSPPHTGGTGDIGGGVGSGGGDVCSLPSDMGPCSDYVLRYTFNSSTGRCEMFYYGGCEGNENRFESLEDCQRRCESSVSRDPCAGVRCGNNAYCVSGYCYCEQGYEGDANVECRPVSTPGHSELCGGYRCGENAECVNGFCKCNEGFYGDPLQSCRFIGGDVPSPNPKCRMPIAAGSCFAHIISYGYNSRTGRCEQFFYTGCLGNENRFNTYEECERECGVSEASPPPLLPTPPHLSPPHTTSSTLFYSILLFSVLISFTASRSRFQTDRVKQKRSEGGGSRYG